MTDDCIDGRFPEPEHPNLNTRTRHLIAETRDLKTGPPLIIRSPVSLCSTVLPNRHPPTAIRHHLVFVPNKRPRRTGVLFRPV